MHEFDSFEKGDEAAHFIPSGMQVWEGKLEKIDLTGFACYGDLEVNMITMPTIDMVATGRNIMGLREAAGLSVRDIQDIFGFATPQAVYKWQRGTALPTIDNLVVLATIFGVTIDRILVVDDNTNTKISA